MSKPMFDEPEMSFAVPFPFRSEADRSGGSLSTEKQSSLAARVQSCDSSLPEEISRFAFSVRACARLRGRHCEFVCAVFVALLRLGLLEPVCVRRAKT